MFFKIHHFIPQFFLERDAPVLCHFLKKSIKEIFLCIKNFSGKINLQSRF